MGSEDEQRIKRSWMYNKPSPYRAGITEDFFQGVHEFIDFATAQFTIQEIRCPCTKCRNMNYMDPKNVRQHLYQKGFTPGYYNWICHGESRIKNAYSPAAQSKIQEQSETTNKQPALEQRTDDMNVLQGKTKAMLEELVSLKQANGLNEIWFKMQAMQQQLDNINAVVVKLVHIQQQQAYASSIQAPYSFIPPQVQNNIQNSGLAVVKSSNEGLGQGSLNK